VQVVAEYEEKLNRGKEAIGQKRCGRVTSDATGGTENEKKKKGEKKSSKKRFRKAFPGATVVNPEKQGEGKTARVIGRDERRDAVRKRGSQAVAGKGGTETFLSWEQ